jgi:uncharacterized protein (UPF0147 family)
MSNTGTAVAPAADSHLDLGSLSAHIATELAAGLSDAAAIRKRYEITDAQWDRLKNNPVFREMVKEAISKLRGDLNAGKRITLKSEIALEDSIPTLYTMINDPQVPANARVEGFKVMAALAGRNLKGDAGINPNAGNGGFNIAIQINTGREEKTVTIDAAPQDLMLPAA